MKLPSMKDNGFGFFSVKKCGILGKITAGTEFISGVQVWIFILPPIPVEEDGWFGSSLKKESNIQLTQFKN